MFKDIKIIKNENGSEKIIFDIKEEEIPLLEEALGVSSENKIEFEESFQKFVNEALESYINRKSYDTIR